MAPRSASANRSPTDSPRILVVEDDPDLRSLIFLGLLLQGMRGDAAADGLEGLKFATERWYDVVISDIRLPGLSGIELARRLQEREPAPKVILMTAYAGPETLRGAAAAGATRVLSKPLSLKLLAQTVYDVFCER